MHIAARVMVIALAFASARPADGLEPATPALAALPVAAAPPVVTMVSAPEQCEEPDDGRRTMRRLPSNLGHTTVGVVSGDNLVAFLAGGVATASASFLDDNVHDAVDESQSGWGDTFESGGGPVYAAVFVAGMFTTGRFTHNTRFRAMTYDMLDAAIVTFGYTEVIKLATDRERPNGQDNKSFPSGHTSNAFALASVAQAHYGWKAGVPSYLLAGVIGASRINQEKHWFSDVVAGAALGYVVGRTVVRVNDRPLAPRSRKASLSVSPIFAGHVRGLQMTIVF